MKNYLKVSPVFYIACILFVMGISTAHAQREESENACAKTLTSARNAYDKGRIELVPDMLASCIENGFNDVEIVEAYKLLILSYLYYDERKSAEEAMYKFLKIKPEYKINPVVDPPEFINLYNRFRTKPIFLIGGKIGGNMTMINVDKNYSLDNTANSLGNYKSNPGYQAGISLDVPIFKNFSLATELNVQANSYTYTKKEFGFLSLTFDEQQLWGELPLAVRYNFGKSNIQYYVQVGGSVSYLLSAKATVERTDSVNVEIGNRSVSGPSIDLKPQRESINYGIIGGLGMKMKDVLGNGYLYVDLRYTYGLPNVVNAKARYDNNELQYKYSYLDNDFSMQNAYISVGYLIPIYKPKLVR